jgi:HEAT repeat protein
MTRSRAFCLLLIAAAGLTLCGCEGGVSNERKAELLHDLRKQTTAYKPVTSDQDSALTAPGLNEPYARVLSVQETVADALGRIGPDAVPALIKALSHPDVEVRVEAAHSLALIGARAQAAVPELARLLSDEHEEVRRGAARALGQIGPAASSAIPALLRLMEMPISREPPTAEANASQGAG